MSRPDQRPETKAVRAGVATDRQFGAVIPPIYLSSTYSFAGLREKRTYDYSRTANPTRDTLGGALTELEEGAGAVVTSTGLSAVLLVLQLLKPGDRLVAPHDCYGGTRRLLDTLAERGHFKVEYCNRARRRNSPGRWLARPGWCGSRRPATRFSGSPT